MHLLLAAVLLLGLAASHPARAGEELGLGTAILHFPSEAWSPPPLVVLAPGPALWDVRTADLRDALLDAGLAVLEPLVEEPDPLAVEADLAHHPRLDIARVAVVALEEGEQLRAVLWLGCGPVRETLVASAGAVAFAKGGHCDAMARAWAATGASVRRAAADGSAPSVLGEGGRLLPLGEGSPRLLVEPWPRAARPTTAEAVAALRRGLLGEGP